MTDRELAEKAEQHLKATTITYQDWKRRVDQGKYNPKDGSTTEWGKAFGALDQIDADTDPPDPTEPVPGYGSKLPAMFAQPTQTQTFTGAIGNLNLSGTDKLFRFDGATINGTIFMSNMLRCTVDFQNCESRGAHDGIKFTGNVTDVWVKNFDIAGVRNQGILAVGGGRRVWLTDGVIANNNPDPNNPDWRTQTHGIYLGSQGAWEDGVLGNVSVLNQKTGYGFQGYESCQRLIVTGCTFNTPGTSGFRSDVGIATLWSGSSAGNILVNTVGRDCRGPLAAGGAGARQPAVKLTFSAEVNCGDYPDGQPGAVDGTPGSDPSIVGDPGYRVPWDTRLAGIGAF